MARKKAGTRKAIQFFEDNFIMIASLEAKGEEGCAEKILNILRHHAEKLQEVKNVDITNQEEMV